MKQRKIAISLAIVGAIAAPLVFRTYKAKPLVSGFLPLTAEQREDTVAYLAKLNNCIDFDTIPLNKLPPEAFECSKRKGLLKFGEHYSDFSMPKYLALNLAVVVAGFVVIFGMVYLLPALARRYWRWLNT